MNVVVMIPARLAATRLPNKPLVDIAGKPMVQWVYEKSLASHADAVYIVTPDDEIAAVAHGFNAPVIMTSHAHQTGTDRLAEAVALAQRRLRKRRGHPSGIDPAGWMIGSDPDRNLQVASPVVFRRRQMAGADVDLQ